MPIDISIVTLWIDNVKSFGEPIDFYYVSIMKTRFYASGSNATSSNK